MSDWYMLTLVGKDQAGIVAAVAKLLFENNANLGEAQMQRLGGCFTTMLMVEFADGEDKLTSLLMPCTKELGLKLHVDAIDGELHKHLAPNVIISFYGADRPGIVASVTQALTEAGLHILDLQTDVAGTSDKPIFIMQIEGHSEKGIDVLKQATSTISDLDIKIEPLDTVLA